MPKKTAETADKYGFKAKADKIIKSLDETVFDLSDDDVTDTKVTRDGDTVRTKRATKRNEIKPTCTPTKISCALYGEFIDFPIIKQPEEIPPDGYKAAYKQFIRLMGHINEYAVVSASKQLFCGFCGITVKDYNELLTAYDYSAVFQWIDDTLVSINLITSESGLADSRPIREKLAAEKIGHSMKRASDGLPIFIQPTISQEQIRNELDRFEELAGIKKIK